MENEAEMEILNGLGLVQDGRDRALAVKENVGPGGLHAPYVIARGIHSLAIAITIVQSFFSLFATLGLNGLPKGRP